MREKGIWQEHPGLIEDLKDWKQRIQWSINKTDTLITKIHMLEFLGEKQSFGLYFHVIGSLNWFSQVKSYKIKLFLFQSLWNNPEFMLKTTTI